MSNYEVTKKMDRNQYINNVKRGGINTKVSNTSCIMQQGMGR